jgi:WhiB family redox-sensing transcriptional regulator
MADWRERAACRGHDPELWFPVSYAPRTAAERDGIKLAREICHSCPVRLDCLEFAARTGQRGIWGGMDEEERRSSRLCRKMRAGVLAGR